MDMSSDVDETGHLGVGPQFPIPMPKIRMVPFDNRIIAPTRNQTNPSEHASLNVSIF